MNQRFALPALFSLTTAALLAAAPAGTTSAETLDLAGAYRLAAENDPAFLAAAAERDVALEAVAIARAGLLPNVSLASSAALERDDVDRPVQSDRSDTYSTLSLTLEATQPLYRPERRIRLGQARTNEEKAEVDYALKAQQLIERVVERYFGVLQASDDFRFAQTNREAIAQQLRQAQQRFEVGLIAITDVEEAKARFDLASARKIEAENALGNAEEAMRETIGEYPRTLAALGEEIPLAIPDPPDIDEWTGNALEHNLPVQSASFAVAVAKEAIRLAETDAGPTVDAFGRATMSDRNDRYAKNDRGRPSSESESRSAAIGVRLQWPIYTGRRVSAETRQARSRHREAIHALERARREAVRQTRQAYLGVESAIARVGALRQAVTSSRSALDAVDAGFQVGTRTSVDVLDAQRDLFQARNDLAAARYDYIRNALGLRLAAGTLAPADLDTVNGWLE